MEQRNIYQGTGVALVTPFKQDKSVDFPALKKLVEHVIDGGVDFLVVMGTTAESVTLDDDEKTAVLNYIADINDKKLPIVLGMGGNNTKSLTAKIKQSDLSHVDALLSVVPYYNKPSQEGLYQHFKQVAESTDKDIILYNVPGRTGKDMASDTTLRLARDFDNNVAVKEASGDFDKAMDIIINKPEGFQVLSGEDPVSLPLISLGMSGVISVVANAYPYEWSEMVKATRHGNLNEARLLHYVLIKMIRLMFAEGNPVGVKSCLAQLGIIENYLRLPLVPASNKLNNDIADEIARIRKIS
ncbi:MAG: 4-hydroxy-tetrahydrodipicolinate synthase [Candidatus Delongbacteria bacterium]|jgi:4-hydroxy-tetrahydrodipicolinate synthase|nr:4-hydroxy-tetrahydrodipicolinate synthase [Candidatus Delongbacteria bacterium]